MNRPAETPVTVTLPALLRGQIETAVCNLRARIPAAMGCVVATVDGRLLAHAVDEADPKRISEMLGPMLARSEVISRELQMGRTQFAVVHAVQGLLVLCRVPARRELFIVGTLARTNTNLGIVLHETQATARLVGQAIDDWVAKNVLP